ncbi:DedA family protein [Mesorhizobium sp. L-8-10]|uniref:DedA family protein n=1 Tax=unclassified Mesorhizobium TaxID=325217 RepID=UPI001927498B|nr:MULTISPECIES: DedA family protein [unclassified Mesorhizobium]BCH24660.1 DedA family protein [Mesorhizobium sp. L-8-3]BCH32396.1 DedA family protein [Mesorhizobium sp. L-8-10]
MTDTIHLLVERYGLIAIFLGCLAEGESAAILGGFFAHQHVFAASNAFGAAFLGAFIGDTLFFLAGRRFSDHAWVVRLRGKPGFSHAYALVRAHPALYVLGNRFVYGFRLVGGVAAGLSGIAVSKFVLLNALSALVWAAAFTGLGYVFGLGAEQIFGAALAKHEKLLAGLGIGLASSFAGWYLAHRLVRRHRD